MEQQTTRLYCAIRWGHGETAVSILVEDEVDGDFSDDAGRTLLSWATENNLENVVSLLLARSKKTLNVRDVWGRSPYWYASGNRHKHVRMLLASEGATL